MFEPERLIQEYESPDGDEVRLEGIRHAIEQADLAEDYSYMMYFRFVYACSCGEYGDGLLRYIYDVFPEMFRLFKEHPDIQMPDCCCLTADEAVWKVFNWVVDCADYFYHIPLWNMELYLEFFKLFSLDYGYGLREYYVASARFYRDIDSQKSLSSFEAYKKLNREEQIENAETIAFECEMEVCFGNIEKALDILKPLMEGEYQDDMRLCFEYGRFFYYYVTYEQDMEKGAEFYKRMEYLRKELQMPPMFFGATVLYLVLTDFDAAWKYYKKWALHEAGSTIPQANIEFAIATVIMMKYLLKHGRTKVQLRLPERLPCYRADGRYQTEALISYFDKEARELSGRFDLRNGTSEYMDDYKINLKAAKIWDGETKEEAPV